MEHCIKTSESALSCFLPSCSETLINMLRGRAPRQIPMTRKTTNFPGRQAVPLLKFHSSNKLVMRHFGCQRGSGKKQHNFTCQTPKTHSAFSGRSVFASQSADQTWPRAKNIQPCGPTQDKPVAKTCVDYSTSACLREEALTPSGAVTAHGQAQGVEELVVCPGLPLRGYLNIWRIFYLIVEADSFLAAPWWLMGFQFPDQVLNPGPWQCRVSNHWTAREFTAEDFYVAFPATVQLLS